MIISEILEQMVNNISNRSFSIHVGFTIVPFSSTAGVDTTRLTLNWFLCFMSGLPEIQAKCQEEIDNKIGT